MHTRAISLNIFSTLRPPVVIVAHDAGAANHIAAWLSRSIPKGLEVCGSLTGPAVHIFEHQCFGLVVGTLGELLPRCHTLISGTGWASALEHDARKLARQIGCRSIAVIDHWTNYRERFIRQDEEVLPDEIWVTDEYAQQLAEAEFQQIPVACLPNLYLENLVCEVRQHERREIKAAEMHILYALEPIREKWGEGRQPGEFQALDFFVRHLAVLCPDGRANIRLRPHPSDNVGKYAHWIESQDGLEISLDPSPSLAASIAWADLVVGCQTYAMVVALAAGRRVVSSNPPWAPRCELPHAEIFKLADLV